MICGDEVLRPREAERIRSVAREKRPVRELSVAPEKDRPREWPELFMLTGGGLLFSNPIPSRLPLGGAGGGGGGGGICNDCEDW